MPLFGLRSAHDKIKRVADPGDPDKWSSAQFEDNTRRMADRIYYCERSTEDDPITDFEGNLVPHGKWAMLHDSMGEKGYIWRHVEDTEWFEKAYFDLDELPEDEYDMANKPTPDGYPQTA